jgi:hypothetical protein
VLCTARPCVRVQDFAGGVSKAAGISGVQRVLTAIFYQGSSRLDNVVCQL